MLINQRYMELTPIGDFFTLFEVSIEVIEFRIDIIQSLPQWK